LKKNLHVYRKKLLRENETPQQTYNKNGRFEMKF